MRHALGVWLVVVMLATTTPFGTDDAEHRDQLLHSVFPHLHVLDSHEVKQTETLPAHQPGPALGAGSGADGVAAGLALTPPLPLVGAWWSLWASGQRLRDANEPLPRGRAEAPPHPPPTRTAFF
jgi:hypothetical protein